MMNVIKDNKHSIGNALLVVVVIILFSPSVVLADGSGVVLALANLMPLIMLGLLGVLVWLLLKVFAALKSIEEIKSAVKRIEDKLEE